MKSRPPSAARSPSFLELLLALALAAMLAALIGSHRSVTAAHRPQLIISEVHPAASRSDSPFESHEWVELHNVGPEAVELKGWFLEDAQAISALPDYSLRAGQIAVIVGRSTNLVVPTGKTLIILSTSRIGNGLRNAGDRVALIDPYGVRHDAISWGDVKVPRYTQAPGSDQSIKRTAIGGQRRSNVLSPWANEQSFVPRPQRGAHPRPDTLVRIVTAQLDQTERRDESVTIRNISDQPLLSINWRMTVGSSSIPLRAVRINPGRLFTITEADGEIGSGLSRRGGHLVLRDARGVWLATASWGDDHTFHDLPAPERGAQVHFTQRARLHPQIPWRERFEALNRTIVGDWRERQALVYENALSRAVRVEPRHPVRQESQLPAVWISEVYAAAGQGRNDASYEWFELTNSSDAAVDLAGWTIADNRASDPLDQLVIPPHSSVLVAGTAEAAPAVALAMADGRIGNGLANAGDQLTLINAAGVVVSAISWGDDRTYTNAKTPTPEQSIQRSSPDAVPTLAAPTPGEVRLPPPAAPANDAAEREVTAESSQAADADTPATPDGSSSGSPAVAAAEPSADAAAEPPGTAIAVDLRITELLPAPLPGEAEWVEIFNPTEQFVDLTGWSIGDLNRRTPLAGILAPRSFLLVANRDLDSPAAVLVVDRIGNSLNNDADAITLYDPQGLARFTIRYGTEDAPAPGQGLSLALDPERWVVTAVASPGTALVTPLLDEAFRSPTVTPTTADPDRLPLVAEPPSEGLNAWMIVSFALIGVILTLIVRRWQPQTEPPAEAAESSAGQSAGGARYSGPAPERSGPDEPFQPGGGLR